MKLYHGTSFKHLEKILKIGIAPRFRRKTVWPDNPSRKDMVYLTTAYPFYFAQSAAMDKSKLVVFETNSDNLNNDRIFPDEDFIYQQLKIQKQELPLEDIRDMIDGWQIYWKDSIKGLGNCAYQGLITTSSITRYCIADLSERSTLTMNILDPSISLMNYKFMGEYYRQLVAWFFGDVNELPQVKQSKE